MSVYKHEETGGSELLAAVEQWPDGLGELHAHIARRFRRPEVRGRARRYLVGLLSRVERKNGWQLAEQMGEAGPQGAQRFLNAARWDADAVRDDLREYAVRIRRPNTPSNTWARRRAEYSSWTRLAF